MIRWVIWYDDDSSFTNLDGEPHQAPRMGALCIASYAKDHGRIILHGKEADFFFWEDDGWLSCHYSGLLDYLARPGAEKIVIQGRHVHPDKFYRIYALADSDPRLPPRSSTNPLEHEAPRP